MCVPVWVCCVPICISIEETAYTFVPMQDKVRYHYWASILCSSWPMFLRQSIHWTWFCQFRWTGWGKPPWILSVNPLGARTRVKGTCHQFGYCFWAKCKKLNLHVYVWRANTWLNQSFLISLFFFKWRKLYFQSYFFLPTQLRALTVNFLMWLEVLMFLFPLPQIFPQLLLNIFLWLQFSQIISNHGRILKTIFIPILETLLEIQILKYTAICLCN